MATLPFDALYRRSVLAIAETGAVRSLITGVGWRMGVKRFVAGETLEEAILVSRGLHAQGLGVILDVLGEFVDSEQGATEMTQAISRTIEKAKELPGERVLSVKPTQLGLAVDFELALANARHICEHAARADVHVCLDMENYPNLDKTLRLFGCVHQNGFRNVSTVLQSYLYRTQADLRELLTFDPKPELRIVKGAYLESEDVAMANKQEVDRSFRELMFVAFEGGAKVNVATHDEAILREAQAFVRGAKLPTSRYEFQLLYGVKPQLQRALVQAGHPVRVYLPFGKDWYGYFSRRLAERPANLLFVLRGMFG